MIKKLFLFVGLVSFSSSGLMALTVTPTGATVTVEYDEPNTNMDGTPLTDLESTSIFFKAEGGSDMTALVVPASGTGGNGHIIREINIPLNQGVEGRFDIWATAKDDDGNISEKSEIKSLTLDKLAPAAPR